MNILCAKSAREVYYECQKLCKSVGVGMVVGSAIGMTVSAVNKKG